MKASQGVRERSSRHRGRKNSQMFDNLPQLSSQRQRVERFSCRVCADEEQTVIVCVSLWRTSSALSPQARHKPSAPHRRDARRSCAAFKTYVRQYVVWISAVWYLRDVYSDDIKQYPLLPAIIRLHGGRATAGSESPNRDLRASLRFGADWPHRQGSQQAERQVQSKLTVSPVSFSQPRFYHAPPLRQCLLTCPHCGDRRLDLGLDGVEVSHRGIIFGSSCHIER
jgi:hypothetical protein